MNRIEYYRTELNNKGLSDVEKYILYNTAKEQDMSKYRFTQFLSNYIKVRNK